MHEQPTVSNETIQSGTNGGWIDGNGNFHSVNHERGRYHAEIVAENIGIPRVGKDEELVPQDFVDYAIIHGWIRVTVTRAGIYFHFSPKLLKKPAYRAMVRTIQGPMAQVAYGFDVLCPTVFATFDTPKESMRWLNENVHDVVI